MVCCNLWGAANQVILAISHTCTVSEIEFPLPPSAICVFKSFHITATSLSTIDGHLTKQAWPIMRVSLIGTAHWYTMSTWSEMDQWEPFPGHLQRSRASVLVSLVIKLRCRRHKYYQWPHCLLCGWIQVTNGPIKQRRNKTQKGPRHFQVFFQLPYQILISAS